jgi:hypothetical protein
MKRPIESDYTSLTAYTRALEEYCDALAQPEQEPVAWIYRPTGALFDICPNDADVGEFLPLYFAPFTGDIRAMKHRIHELEGELIGYKKIIANQDAMLERQTARIVDLQTHIENFDGEDR